MADVGTRFPLTSRRAEGLMPFPVTDRRTTVAAYPSLLTAGADEAEADPPEAVAAYPSVIDAERDPLYGDRVQDARDVMRWAALAQCNGAAAAYNARERAEAIRQSRLSRWQEQR